MMTTQPDAGDIVELIAEADRWLTVYEPDEEAQSHPAYLIRHLIAEIDRLRATIPIPEELDGPWWTDPLGNRHNDCCFECGEPLGLFCHTCRHPETDDILGSTQPSADAAGEGWIRTLILLKQLAGNSLMMPLGRLALIESVITHKLVACQDPTHWMPAPAPPTEPAGRLEGGGGNDRSAATAEGGAGAAVSSSTQPSADAAGEWVLVPREPTREMLVTAALADVPWEYEETETGATVWGPFVLELSGPNKDSRAKEIVAAIYRAMLSASPSPTWGDEQRDEWRPISDSEPAQSRIVLLAYWRDDPGDWVIHSGDRGPPRNDRWDDDTYTPWHMDGRSLKAWDHLPTHWRPLPPPPRAALSALQEG